MTSFDAGMVTLGTALGCCWRHSVTPKRLHLWIGTLLAVLVMSLVWILPADDWPHFLASILQAPTVGWAIANAGALRK